MSARGGLPTIAVTAGEPAGVGPEICTALKTAALPARIVVIADRALLRARTGFAWPDFAGGCTATEAGICVLHVPLAAPSIAGNLDPANSTYVLRTLGIACDGCTDKLFDAMATAPVHKGVINDAGVAFTGHTEFLEERTRSSHVVMMLAGMYYYELGWKPRAAEYFDQGDRLFRIAAAGYPRDLVKYRELTTIGQRAYWSQIGAQASRGTGLRPELGIKMFGCEWVAAEVSRLTGKDPRERFGRSLLALVAARREQLRVAQLNAKAEPQA